MNQFISVRCRRLLRINVSDWAPQKALNLSLRKHEKICEHSYLKSTRQMSALSQYRDNRTLSWRIEKCTAWVQVQLDAGALITKKKRENLVFNLSIMFLSIGVQKEAAISQKADALTTALKLLLLAFNYISQNNSKKKKKKKKTFFVFWFFW